MISPINLCLIGQKKTYLLHIRGVFLHEESGIGYIGGMFCN